MKDSFVVLSDTLFVITKLFISDFEAYPWNQQKVY